MKSFLKLEDVVILEVCGAGVAGRELLILELEPVLELLELCTPEEVAVGAGDCVSSKAAML